MKTHEIVTNSENETKQIAARLAVFLKPGDVVTLEGDLGAGKTAFAKGIASGLGVKETISSPTFTIIKEYEGNIPFYHMDAYRLEYAEEDIGFDEYFEGEGISVVEWASFIETFLPENRMNIKITYVDEHMRKLEFTASGFHYEVVLNDFMRYL
ncbi:tRNA (adenosine(37)-N6)-threonylcarbamoyltransferase complex ATPase subunit type 1 TsaE [Virgibacillus sp. YIM 98842]|uniref:tRNA (adenosine(37)-N6)-threonylcarbamoyltransferase complex ATPase subunit type 1 TsaE n=1 Tax=Virgibacillus sp. YIM 98842 TaxID=2663533 RepID=UPI0013DD1CBC|nr:tRNA (adenosine(37)-N6)-threonylcarbamoyltransferase complex ATPase subunit type 1 TsaE [Virgibacillus sp. YIM 98842]